MREALIGSVTGKLNILTARNRISTLDYPWGLIIADHKCRIQNCPSLHGLFLCRPKPPRPSFSKSPQRSIDWPPQLNTDGATASILAHFARTGYSVRPFSKLRGLLTN